MLNFAFLFLFLIQQADEVSIVSDPGGKWECVESPEQACTWTGGVTATYQDVVVKGESVTYNRTNGTLTAEQRVNFTRGNEHLEGERLFLNLRAKAGSIQNVNGNLGP